MQTNGFRGTADPGNQGPVFMPEVNKNVSLNLIAPDYTTCCDCCCGGKGRGCSLDNGIKSFSIWYGIVSFVMFIYFLALAMNQWLASFGFFVFIYGLIHGLCSFEGFRLIHFENPQEYHVRGKRLFAIYVIVTTINSCITIAISIVSIQWLFWNAWALLFWLVYGLPFFIHSFVCYRSIKTLKQYFKVQSYQAHTKLQNK